MIEAVKCIERKQRFNNYVVLHTQDRCKATKLQHLIQCFHIRFFQSQCVGVFLLYNRFFHHFLLFNLLKNLIKPDKKRKTTEDNYKVKIRIWNKIIDLNCIK